MRLTAFLTSPYAKGFLGALGGLALVALGIHLWSDHVALHAVINYLNVHADKINHLP